MHKVLVAIGTRPEVIKMAPVIRALKAIPSLETITLATAQHREMLDQMLNTFDITPDIDLNVMTKRQTLATLTAKLSCPLDALFKKLRPNMILAQGDTTTTFMVGLSSYYQKIPFGHIEAGLRTGKPFSPFPEEMNRQLLTRLATWHFAPTKTSKDNLLKEGIDASQIFVTGNTVIDAVDTIVKKVPKKNKARQIFVTTHRRENIGKPQENICKALLDILDLHPDTHLLLPVHPNPFVAKTIRKYLEKHPRITLSPPLDYPTLISELKNSSLILSDSGGIQEEAVRLGIPLLILRDTTDRPEAVLAGCSQLIGTDRKDIIQAANLLLKDSSTQKKIQKNLYGDGQAGVRIALHVQKILQSTYTNRESRIGV